MEEIEFEHIVSKLRPKLASHCRRYIETSTIAIDVEDVIQETLIQLWKMRNELFQYQSIEALAMTIARNRCIDHIRRDHQATESIDSNSHSAIITAASSVAADQALIGEDMQRRIDLALDKLPTTQRRMLLMRSEGASLDKIAETCGTNKTSTKTMISAARRTLLKLMKQ